MNTNRVCSRAVFAAFLCAVLPVARGAFPTVALKPVCLQQIHSPTTITHAPDGSGRLFVCDQPGKIYIIQSGMLLPTPFLNIASTTTPPPDNGPGPVIAVGAGYSERGLLGLVFHPGYANPQSPGYRRFYLNYVKPYVSGVDAPPLGPLTGTNPGTLNGNSVSVIAEYQVSATNPNVALPASERRILLYTQPQSNHNGGQVEFGPEVGPSGERYLYIGVGDGGSQQDNDLGHTGGNNTSPRPTNGLGNGQDKTRLCGKILRIDPLGNNGPGGQYGIPASNPFFSDPNPNVRKEIYAFGLRNPWRFSFDKRAGGTNRMFCGDVGGDRIEEVDIIVSGGNYGWRYKEGTEFPLFSSGAPTNPMPDPGQGPYIDPIAQYAHPGAVTSPVLPQLGLSITGGFVYRGAAIPALQGKYVFGDYGSTNGASNGRMMGLEETAPLSGVFTLTQAIPINNSSNPIVGQRILCLGEDESGEIYIGMKSTAGVLSQDGGLPAGSIWKIVPLQSYSATLYSAKDSSIFSEDTTPTAVRPYWPFTSDGQGNLYAGRTGTNYGPYLRRALVAFDVAGQLPAGAIIQSAQLRLQLTRLVPNSAGKTISVKRLTETWGEGASINLSEQGFGAAAMTDDATWTRRFFNTSTWTTPGGTFAPTASATAIVPSLTQPMTWGPNAQLAADVQGWLDTPAGNAGWILIGDETVNNTACQFASLQLGGIPPSLLLTYDSAPSLSHRETWLQTYFRVGQFVDDLGDLEGDGFVNLIEYANGLSPIAKDSAGAAIQVASEVVGANTVFTFTFRRDPEATDLTYTLQASGDLANWTDIVTSIAGGDPTGSGYLGESDIPGEEPKRLVTAQETLPTAANPERYVRLRVNRVP